MEGKDTGKTYSVYKIFCPSRRCYIGYTSMPVMERWRHHKRRAFSNECPEHPFYNDIRENPDAIFPIAVLHRTKDRDLGMLMEKMEIAAIPKEASLNLTSGGVDDGREGGKIFWERINADPELRAAYLKKLSDAKKANDWTDYDDLAEKAKQWRKENPRLAYKMAYRAIRIANRAQGHHSPGYVREDPRPLKERLMHRYRLNEVKRQYVTEVWANRSEEERAEIGRKIGIAQKAHMQSLTDEERREATSKARESIDRSVQGPAASRGVKRWWEELRKDPARYQDYMDRRNATLRETLKRKKENEDV